jgi:asparagine synthase (glutamine-hydrolysing)
MFHGLVADQTSGIATLFNDRYGMHRLYYHDAKDAFYFGAEAKAIVAVRPELRSPDPKSMGEVIACSCVLENRTIFKGVYAMPAGSVWTFRGGSVESKRQYFRPCQWEEQSSLEPEAYYRELRSVLTRNLPRYFDGPEPIGIALTGGLDTRVIMAYCKPAPGMLSSYTFGGMFRESQDVAVARHVAAKCQQPHQVISVGSDFLSGFPEYAERTVYLTEGGVDVYRASDLYLSERAREIAPVKIVGTYGSEVLRRAVMFQPVSLSPELLHPEFHRHVEEAATTYSQFLRGHPLTFAAFCQFPWYHHGILALEQTQLTVRSPFLDNDFVQAVYRAPKSKPGDDIRLRLISDGNTALARIRSDRGVGGNGHISSTISRSLLEFTFKAEYAYDYGMPQWLARIDHALSALRLERLFIGRHKLLHFRLWYRDRLSDYVRQMLLDPRTLSRPHLERRGVEAVVEGHLKGDRNFTIEIHRLLTLELLYRKFFDAN